MEYSQVAQILNEVFVPNILGEENTIQEDLSNVVDLGTKIDDVTAEQLKDYTTDFVARVIKTYFDSRVFTGDVDDLFIDYNDYGGVVQRVKAGLMPVTDDISTNLQNGTTYNQDTYLGISFDNKVYTRNAGFELDWSIPHNMWKVAEPSDVMQIVGYIKNRAEQALNANLFAMKMTVYRALIATHADNRVKLCTIYNTIFNLTGTADAVTATNYKLNADFMRWASEQIVLIKKYIQDISAKGNDGTIVTHTPAKDVRVTLLSMFATDLKFHMTSDVFHKELVDIGDYSEVNFWQNSGDKLLPTDLSEIGQVKTDIEGAAEGASQIEVDNVVGIIRDRFSCGITAHQRKVTSHYNAKGDFTNYFQRVPANYFLDSRENAVIITLE